MIGGGVALSIALATIAEWVISIKTPGAYVHAVLFPPLAGGSYDHRLVLFVLVGVDSLSCFAILSVLYLLSTKLSNRSGNGPS